jgi:hypothetical protein
VSFGLDIIKFHTQAYGDVELSFPPIEVQATMTFAEWCDVHAQRSSYRKMVHRGLHEVHRLESKWRTEQYKENKEPPPPFCLYERVANRNVAPYVGIRVVNAELIDVVHQITYMCAASFPGYGLSALRLVPVWNDGNSHNPRVMVARSLRQEVAHWMSTAINPDVRIYDKPTRIEERPERVIVADGLQERTDEKAFMERLKRKMEALNGG